jgi:hypothetical protein
MNRISVWIDHGLKHARWPVDRARQMILLVVLAALIAGAYLLQSSQIVTTSRHVESLGEELDGLRRRNALLLALIAQATTGESMLARAKTLGFEPAASIEFVRVPIALHDDVPTLLEGYAQP